MAADSGSLGAIWNVAVGAFLIVFGFFVWRWSADRAARGLLATYLCLAGSNYLVDAFGALLTILGLPTPWWKDLVATIPNDLDPAFLLFYALAVTRGRVGKVAPILALAPGVWLLAGSFLAHTANPFPPLGNRVRVAYILVCYLTAFFLMAVRYVRAQADRDRLGVLVVAFAPIALPRLGLAYLDLGIVHAVGGRSQPKTLIMEAGLLLAFAAFALTCRLLSSRAAWPEVRRTVVAVGSLLLIVDLVWLLRFAPILAGSAFPLAYSVRWLLFVAVITAELRRQEILGMPTTLVPWLRLTFMGMLILGAAAMLGSLLANLLDASSLGVLLDSMMLVGLVVLGILALRRALPPPQGELEERRARVFRAYALLDASEAELEDMRRRLGLAPAEAKRIRELVALERAMPAASTGPMPGRVLLGRYEVERVVGAGAFGRALAARDRLDGAQVVIKELLPEWTGDPEALLRFRREAEVVLSLDHPNVVGFRALEPTEGGYLLVLDRVEGETLAARLQRGPLSSQEARDIARQALAGLAALHARGIVHRDVKPANLMLERDGRVVILDMGTATPGPEATRPAGPHPGSPAYMSPEQEKGGKVDATTDLYALGVVLWEALTGRLPPQGAPPQPWRAVLAKAMAPHRRDRFPDAEAFLAALP